MTKPNSRKVLALIRVSTPGQADPEKDGIPRQLRHIEEHAAKFNLEIVKPYYQLEGVSGTKVQHDPQFKAMLSRLAEPDIAGVVFSRMDRFFRPEHLDAYEIFKVFRQQKKLLFCDLAGNDGLDVSNAQDQMKIQLWGMVAAQERRNIAERNIEGKNQSRKLDNRKSDTLPKGLAWDEKTGLFSYSDFALKSVKKAFKLVLEGHPLLSVSKQLGFGSHSALRVCLANEWWIGNKTHKYTRQYRDETDKHGKKVAIDKPVIVATNLTRNPLVDRETFERVQIILSQNRKTWSQNKTLGNDYLGAGLLTCSCGGKLYFKRGALYPFSTTKCKPNFYVCSNRVYHGSKCEILKADVLEPGIAWTAVRCFLSEKWIAQEIERNATGDGRDALEAEVCDLEKDIKKLEITKTKYVDLVAEDDAFVKKVKELSGMIREKQADLSRVSAKLSFFVSKQDVKALSQTIQQKYWGMCDAMIESRRIDGKPIKAMSVQERKALLLETLDSINVTADGALQMVLKGGTAIRPMSQRAAYTAFLDNMTRLTPAQRKKNLERLMSFDENLRASERQAA